MAIFGLTYDATTLYTLNPDGSVYKTLGTVDHGKNRIGEYKKWKMNFHTSGADNLASKMIVFSPELFLTAARISYSAGNIPLEGYSYLNNAASTPGTYAMYLNVSSPYYQGVIQNWRADITIITSTEFYIELYYYHVYDLSDFINSSIEDNHSKLLKDQVFAASELTVAGTNVYTSASIIPVGYCIVYDQANPGTTYASSLFAFSGYGAGFYGKDAHEAAPFFTNPAWVLYDNAASPTTQIATTYNTKVKFTVNTGGSHIDKILVWAIKTNSFDNTVDFYANYEASFVECTTAASGTLDNKIVAPSQAVSLVSGATYDCFFHMDKTLIAVGDTYRFIAIVYLDEYSIYNVNSFISDEYTVGLPDFNGTGYAFEAKLTDYINDYTGNDLTCVVEERIQSTVTLDYSYNAFKNDMLNRLGLTLANNDIRRYMTKITCEIYEEIGATIHYLKRDIAYKVNPTTYTIPTDMTMNFTGEILDVIYRWRNRYESNIANIETTVSGIIVTPSSNQDWGGRTLKVRTQIELYYDDYVTPFSDTLQFFQQITVKDYTTTLLNIEKPDGTAVPAYYCNNEDPCFEADLTLTSPETYKLITTAEPETGSVSAIQENETWLGTLAQLTSTKFSNQEESYSETEASKAKFCLVANNFLLNLPYKISAMAKYAIPSNARITEDGILRDLETTDFRIIET